jgi:digalactosyldiacylglycerol synthase
LEYIKREKNGAVQAFFVKHINNLVARAYCHKVIKYGTMSTVFILISSVHSVNFLHIHMFNNCVIACFSFPS